MKFAKKISDCDFSDEPVQCNKEGEVEMPADLSKYCTVYRELAELVGEAATQKIWKNFSGLTVTFPQRMYSREYTRKFIAENMGTMSPATMAHVLDLSDRRVRQIIRELKSQEKEELP